MQAKLDPRLLQSNQPSTLLSTEPSVGAGFYSHSKQQTRPASESSHPAPFCSHEATLCTFLARGCSRGGQLAPGHVQPLRAADELAGTRAELGKELREHRSVAGWLLTRWGQRAPRLHAAPRIVLLLRVQKQSEDWNCSPVSPCHRRGGEDDPHPGPLRNRQGIFPDGFPATTPRRGCSEAAERPARDSGSYGPRRIPQSQSTTGPAVTTPKVNRAASGRDSTRWQRWVQPAKAAPSLSGCLDHSRDTCTLCSGPFPPA